ncbi:DNA-binding protein [Methylophilus medardicus]|uniref:DNA-binding protein n=1 Tax=Methylophilus medardicus TaxID=2588534 RepID=A0A5B8CTI7_9PROT|nr:DNA-binding protein [Methylophilus medardicus]QDC44593.1 DNA-binding protein [Methylophilus medardicus]QDC49600.1 DNA-binding protein [Methylophilus medardicus]QDC53305.1 DNA-binding protein [Methylophilus medardicus]
MNANQVRNMFNESGLSVSEWARLRGFSSGLVYQVLDGKRKCMRGQSHQIAVALGLKPGSSMNVEELNTKLEKISQEQKMVSL